ncbi:MAG: hypothetical protein AB7O73_01785 [Bacteroidia bacterium]
MSSQNNCEQGFVSDSLFLEGDNAFVISSCLIAGPLENGDNIKLFRHGKKNFLQIETKTNLYFDKVDDLEINSGNQSMLKKGMRQVEKNKYTGLYVVEIYKNYVATLRDEGITSFTFNHTENSYHKNDVKQIRAIAKCFYKTINIKSTK